MKRKRIILLGAAFVIIAGMYVTIRHINQKKYEEMEIKLTDDYLDDQDLLTKANYVYQVKNIQKEKSISYHTVDFTVWNATLAEELDLDSVDAYPLKQIRILQTYLGNTSEFPDLERNGSYILFLDEYTGPIGKDLYVICGVSLGMLEEDKGTIVYNERQKKSFQILKNTQGFEISMDQMKAFIKENRD